MYVYIYMCVYIYVHIHIHTCCCLVAKSYPTLCNPMDCSRQASLSMGFSRQEYWSGLPFPSPECSWPRDGTHVSYIGRCRILYHWATREAHIYTYTCIDLRLFFYSDISIDAINFLLNFSYLSCISSNMMYYAFTSFNLKCFQISLWLPLWSMGHLEVWCLVSKYLRAVSDIFLLLTSNLISLCSQNISI